jgi:hypothetical protein
MDRAGRLTLGLAVLVFAFTAAIYFITLTPTVPFWDAGEFIAVSYILGIPHPPGTPFYVLLGRIATLVPWHTVAERVNALSAVPAALAVMLSYLTTLKMIRLGLSSETRPVPGWLAHAGAATGALMLAFSDSFWENATEAEVYALMSLAQILVLWLGLKWWEEHEKTPTAGPLLLCVYVMWLCVGLHLGVGIMGLPLMLLVWLVDRRAALVFAMPLLTVLLVTMGLERMAGGVIALSTLVFLFYTMQKKLKGWEWGVGAVAALIGMSVAISDKPFTWPTAIVALGAVLFPLALLARRTRDGKILLLALLVMAAGYSTHVYLPIRAALKPAINEGDPSNWSSLRDLLERKQYGQTNMFVRRAPLSVQLDKEFWRYFRRQWPLFSTEKLDAWAADQRAQGRSNFLVERAAAIPWGSLLPLVLGVMGGWWLARRNRVSFLYSACFLALTTVGMIVFLNFSAAEVRERDYFFQSGYHAFSLWIGIGVVAMALWLRDQFATQRWVPAGVGALLSTMPVFLLVTLWYTHDRRGNYVCHDYAYNMLAPLDPNSFMFTNGDNDTFPLWYMQEVEGFRKDVRVVNLSLLNTDWYIRQLRDQEPKVPIDLDDDTVRMLGLGAVRDSAGNIMYTNEFMVHHILSVNHEGSGWKKQPYFAVTVPDHMGLDRQFSLEGLVHRVYADTLHADIDPAKVEQALYQDFKYRGLFRPDGSWDPSVYKDENAATLSRNYMSAHVSLAFHYRRAGNVRRAIQEMERVSRMFPDFTEALIPLGTFYLDAGDTAKAADLFQRLTISDPTDPEAHYYYGVTHIYRGHINEAIRQFETAIQLDPNYSMAYYAAFYALSESGERERALGYLERWVTAHPDDEQARRILEGQRLMMGTEPPRRLLPRPPMPTMP